MTEAPPRPPAQCVLFDLDGTLVDTMPLHFQAYRLVLEELGVEIDFRTFLEASGGAARNTIPRLLGGRSVSADAAEIHRRKIAVAERLFSENPPAPLAAAALLPFFARHCALGLVSSGSRRSVATTLAAMGWENSFGVVVTGDDVARSKPDPEGYLKAADFFGVLPAACLVFEDMDEGVRAGRAAGMTVVDVRDMLPSWRRADGHSSC